MDALPLSCTFRICTFIHLIYSGCFFKNRDCFYIYLSLPVSMCMCTHMCIHVEIGGQLSGILSLLLPWGLGIEFRFSGTCLYLLSHLTSPACFGDGISLSSLDCPWTHSIAQTSLKFMILLIILWSAGVISMCNHIGVQFFCLWWY